MFQFKIYFLLKFRSKIDNLITSRPSCKLSDMISSSCFAAKAVPEYQLNQNSGQNCGRNSGLAGIPVQPYMYLSH